MGTVLNFYDLHGPPRPVLLNRRDASQYRDLGAFLPGLELFLKLHNLPNLTLIR